MHSPAHIQLLGDFCLRCGKEPVRRVSTPRLQSLVAYLVLHRGVPQLRQHTAFRFWPDSTEKQASTNLRHLLHDLRQVWPQADSFLYVDRKTLAWRHDAPFVLDVASFERAVAEADEATQQADWTAAQAALKQAVDVYRGDLLPSCYDEWIEPERERLHQELTRALERLVQLSEDLRDYADAIYYARSLMRHDPIEEATYATLMRLHALHGDRAGALRVYEECAAVLQRELGIAPGSVTRALYERLLDGQDHPASQIDAQPQRHAEELPLVGRHREWAQLKSAWNAAAHGKAHLVVVTGEAGIGKTRLMQELFNWADQQGLAAARTRSYAAEGRLAYAPAADWLRAPPLRAALSRLNPIWLAEISRLLPEIRLEYPDLPDPKPIREGWQSLRLFEALSRAVLARGEPLLLVLDDLQWTDAETLSWLRYLLRFAPEARLLLAGTIRADEMGAEPAIASLLSDLRRDGVLTEIQLGPLGAAETATMATHVSGRLLDQGQAERLYEETEGNPLFVVETVRAGLLDDRLPASLPPKVQAVLTSRLAQLSQEARALAGLAATIGRVFTLDELAEASDEDEVSLVDALDELWHCHIIREHSTGTYDFSHDKLREGAYADTSPARRRFLHRRVARALEALHAGELDAVSGQLAGHYEQAGLSQQAIGYYHRAGGIARDIHANEEAIRFFRKALSLLDKETETPERNEQELALQTALGACLVATRGHTAPEVRQVYERAVTLCQQLGKATDAPILRALGNVNLSSGHLHRAYELGEEILDAARRMQDRILMVEGFYMLGVSSFWMGSFALARRHLDQALNHYDPQQHGTHIALYAQDPKVVCLCRLGRTLWYLGYPDQAERNVENSLSLARVLGHPHSRAYALMYAAHFYIDLGNPDKAQEHVGALLALSTDQALTLWEGGGCALRGAMLVEQGDVEAGTAQLRRGIAMWDDTGGSLSIPQYYGYQARACLKIGAVEDALSALSAAFALVERTGERFYEAELLRLKGELLLAKDVDGNEAASCFQRALDVARRQDARSLELRAAMSLGRLQHRQNRTKEARQRLQDVYDRFTEGFDTPDLEEARALLDAWS